ncbi:hypothetical protein XTPLMG728_0996 [Xanthomonas translucens pv. poae]|uniref:Transposase n=1 Tax=Xanthomonas graminis pv. poae TaxID=227946 RepID=A0A0K2ZLA9_9XANT|nr:hypothetical protein XTPLMG728_0996 [Xanthomonas translucens pv. poae]
MWLSMPASPTKLAFGGTRTPRDEELAQLKRELAQVKKERDFLTEAATLFAKASS